MELKIQKEHLDRGLGFPVKLINCPMAKIRGKWIPYVNYNDLSRIVLRKLSKKESRLSGSEVRFIRQYFDLTLVAFAERFAVSHAAVIKWENKRDKPTEMAWTTEKDIRLFIIFKLESGADAIFRLYALLEKVYSQNDLILAVDAKKVAA